MEDTETKANREHKDSLFTFMFGNYMEWLLELYNALAGTNITDASLLRVVTLKDVLFMNQLNDIAFTIGDNLVVLIEHQSTICENLPLRLLMYIGRVYEKLIDKTAIYKRKLVKLPKPQFIVLYNGKDNFPDHKTLKLSDAFKETSVELRSNFMSGLIDLEIDVYNINEGCNKDIVDKTEHLKGYVIFESAVRNEYVRNGGNLTEALKMALKYCEEHKILSDFLPEHGAEVENMLYTEFNIEDAKLVWKQEAAEDNSIEIARRLFADNLPIEDIVKFTLLPIEQVRSIAQNFN